MISSIYSKTISIFEAGSRKGKKKKDIEKSVSKQLSSKKNKKKSKPNTGGLPKSDKKLDRWLQSEANRLKKLEAKREEKRKHKL